MVDNNDDIALPIQTLIGNPASVHASKEFQNLRSSDDQPLNTPTSVTSVIITAETKKEDSHKTVSHPQYVDHDQKVKDNIFVEESRD